MAPADLSFADAHAVEAAILRGFWLMDHDRADEMPAGVAFDAIVHGLGPSALDHAGLRAYAQARKANAQRRTRHVVTNLHVWAGAPDRVCSSCLLTVRVIDGSPEVRTGFFGDVEDVHERRGDRWLLTERRLVAFAPQRVAA